MTSSDVDRRTAAVMTIEGAVVVSCQAASGSPLDTPSTIAALAQSAALGGAGGFRVDGPANVAAVRAVSDLPIIGIHKVRQSGEVLITPTLEDAQRVTDAGATIVALDGTDRPRPGGETVGGIISALHEVGIPVMADIATRAEAMAAVAVGADLVATTLAGYTPSSRDLDDSGPAFDLLDDLRDLAIPVVVEGRIWTVEHVQRAFEGGAFAVVIGSAITAPNLITRRFVDAARTWRVTRGAWRSAIVDR
jgi:N-acylglucosamine-6-phosphate 2-epimerase